MIDCPLYYFKISPDYLYSFGHCLKALHKPEQLIHFSMAFVHNVLCMFLHSSV